MKSSTTKKTQNVSILRGALVDKLKIKGCILTSHIEAAFRAVPRHMFVPDTPLDIVYADQMIPTKFDQHGLAISSSSQPAIMAIMLEQLGLEPGCRVREIGTGTGYSAALMGHMVGEPGNVVAIDIDEELTQKARQHLIGVGVENVQVVSADGAYGYRDTAPYDRIILTVGASDITPEWTNQLKSGGRLVLPFAIAAGQQSIAFEKVDEQLHSVSMAPCGFMKLRGACAIPLLQLGPDPNLVIEDDGNMPIVPEQVYNWLMGSSKDWETGIEITVMELLYKLDVWLASYHFNSRLLMGRGDLVEQNIVPPLIVTVQETKSVATGIFVKKHGMIAFMRSPEEATLVDDWITPFTLCIRQFGSDKSFVQSILESIRAWDQAGRPPSQELQVRVYPKDFDYSATEDELVIEKPWTRVVLDW